MTKDWMLYVEDDKTKAMEIDRKTGVTGDELMSLAKECGLDVLGWVSFIRECDAVTYGDVQLRRN